MHLCRHFPIYQYVPKLVYEDIFENSSGVIGRPRFTLHSSSRHPGQFSLDKRLWRDRTSVSNSITFLEGGKTFRFRPFARPKDFRSTVQGSLAGIGFPLWTSLADQATPHSVRSFASGSRTVNPERVARIIILYINNTMRIDPVYDKPADPQTRG